MAGKSLLEMFDPRFSWVMTLLLVLSFAALALAIERLIFFGKRRKDVNKFYEKINEVFKTKGKSGVLEMLAKDDSGYAHVARVAFENTDKPKDVNEELMASEILRQRLRLEKFLGGLNTIGYISPLLGLLGTVLGLIKAFMNIAIAGEGGPAVVAQGVGEALLTTAVGLIIAVPVVYIYNYFSKKSSDMVDEMELLARKLSQLIYSSKEQ